MDRSVYLAMSGAKQIWHAMSANTHNLANVNTTGFKADLTAFESRPVHGPGYDSRVYATAEPAGVDFSSGQLVNTGRNLDVAVKGAGFIAVQAPDGREAYTRAGKLQITPAGQLMTGDGRPVMGNGGPIAVPPRESIEIGTDGTISIRPMGQQANALAVVDRIKLVKPDPQQLRKGSDGLFHLRGGGEAPGDAEVTVASGTLERSNVNAVDAMVNMIELSRRFEMQVRMMRTVEDAERSSAELMRMG